MTNDDLIRIRDLKVRFGSEYAASMYVAKKARKLLKKSKNLLSESEAIEWIILERTDADLEAYMNEYRHRIRKRRYNLINEYMSMIDSKRVRKQFQLSALQSNTASKLMIDYGDLDQYDSTRLRILMKEYWLDHLQKDITDISIHA